MFNEALPIRDRGLDAGTSPGVATVFKGRRLAALGKLDLCEGIEASERD